MIIPLALSSTAGILVQFAASLSLATAVVFCLWRFSPLSPRARGREEREMPKDSGGEAP